MSTQETETNQERLEGDICIHIFTASAAMVGVCLTGIGLLRLIIRTGNLRNVGDDLLALDALLFLLSCFLSYGALRKHRQGRRVLEMAADALFLLALSLMVIVCGIIVYGTV